MDKKGLCLLLNVFVAEDAECIAEVAEQFFCDGLGADSTKRSAWYDVS